MPGIDLIATVVLREKSAIINIVENIFWFETGGAMGKDNGKRDYDQPGLNGLAGASGEVDNGELDGVSGGRHVNVCQSGELGLEGDAAGCCHGHQPNLSCGYGVDAVEGSCSSGTRVDP